MLFNSYIFIFAFLPITAIIYFTLNKFKKYKIAKFTLLLASLYFYAYFNLEYLVIIISSIIFNYIIGKILLSTKGKVLRSAVLIFGIIINIASIFYFKYFDFFATSINSIFSTTFNMLSLLLPLGISFFTFQQLSYIIDAYKKDMPKYDLLDYSLFVTFFPQLIAGPIVLHSELVPQFEDESKKRFSFENFSKGLMAFSYGMAKKVIIADTFGIAANYVFDVLGANTNTTNLIFGTFAYTFQIYFDFSGYCDMATGISKMLNIDLPINFNSPYKSYTILEFWKRWHITLTRFFTTYIYIPLGGSKKGNIKTYVNVAIVFLISGIWHGASFSFILWGILHGLASIINRIFKKQIDKLNPVFNWLVTFSFINLTWIVFRSGSISQAIERIKNIFSMNFGSIDINILNAFKLPEINFIFYEILDINKINVIAFACFFLFGIFAVLCMKNTNERIETFKPNTKTLIISVILLVYSIISLSGVSTFLYFNF